jgi:Uma2 family endonuclease
MTKEEFLQLPEGPPDFEFENGEVIPMARPHGQHQRVMKRLLGLLDDHILENRLGEVWPEIDVDLTETLTYVPDLVYLGQEHLDRYSEKDGRIHGAPDLVIEIISPSTSSRDYVRKLKVYFEVGVPWYWLVEPDTFSIAEFCASPEGYLCTATVGTGEIFRPRLFPGLEIDLKTLMEGKMRAS